MRGGDNGGLGKRCLIEGQYSHRGGGQAGVGCFGRVFCSAFWIIGWTGAGIVMGRAHHGHGVMGIWARQEAESISLDIIIHE